MRAEIRGRCDQSSLPQHLPLEILTSKATEINGRSSVFAIKDHILARRDYSPNYGAVAPGIDSDERPVYGAALRSAS